MAEISQLQTLIDSASTLAAEVDLKEEKAANAKNDLHYAKEHAKEAWNKIYDLLLTLAEERKNDESFRNSKLGYMLKGESEKARSGRR